MQRYQLWTQQVAPLVARCLALDASAITLNFLYQDLFHGAKEQGLAEYFMLQMMSEINYALRENALAAQQVHAIVGPCDVNGDMVLRVNLHAQQGGPLLASAEKPFDLAADLQLEVDDICDALALIGIEAVSVALRFDADGAPLEVRSYRRQD
jgi:hypothetical protein